MKTTIALLIITSTLFSCTKSPSDTVIKEKKVVTVTPINEDGKEFSAVKVQ